MGRRTVAGAAALLALVGPMLMAVSPAAALYSDVPTKVAEPAIFPVGLALAPDGRLFFTEKETANIRVVQFAGARSVLSPTPLLTVPRVNGSGEGGLLGIVVDPDWAQTPWLYVFYTADTPNGTRDFITRYWVEGDRVTRNETVLTGLGGGRLHNGGAMAFGPDGKLYVTVGEIWDAPLAQNLSSWQGKVLRLERNGSIPADNPYPGSPVFTWGHRNMYGIAFNPHTGVPYITENGNVTHDEVNLLRPRANYGWPNVTGDANTSPFEDPVWNSTFTIAPTGLAFSTARYPDGGLVDLIFGDWNTGTLHRLVLRGPEYDTVVAEDILAVPNVGVTALLMASHCDLLVAVYHAVISYDLCREPSDLPTAVLQSNRTAQWESFPIAFNATGSQPASLNGSLEFEWDFGDGSSATGQAVEHTWSASGDYRVELVVIEDGARYNVSSVVARIRGLDERLPPELVATVSAETAFEGDPVTLDASGSTGYFSEIVAYRWNFSDGTSASGPVVVHSFERPGQYSATVTIQDETGLQTEGMVRLRVVRQAGYAAPTDGGLAAFLVAVTLTAAVVAAAATPRRPPAH